MFHAITNINSVYCCIIFIEVGSFKSKKQFNYKVLQQVHANELYDHTRHDRSKLSTSTVFDNLQLYHIHCILIILVFVTITVFTITTLTISVITATISIVMSVVTSVSVSVSVIMTMSMSVIMAMTMIMITVV